MIVRWSALRWVVLRLAVVATVVVAPVAAPAMVLAQTATTTAPRSGQVRVTPDVSALPGGAQLQQLVNGAAAFALILLAGAISGGAVLWAVGAAGANYNQIGTGKRMVLLALGGALIIGAAAALVNFFNALGGQI
ncbi:MAG: DUF6112 family protein [Acidimicrobiales bacterium]